MTHKCEFNGINEAAGFGRYDFANPFGIDHPTTSGPGGKYYSLSIKLSNRIQVKHIPGKDNRDITMRTSDVKSDSTGPLYEEITMVQYCITEDQHNKCKELVQYGGPYEVIWAFGPKIILYCVDATFDQEPGFVEPPDYWYGDDDLPYTGFYCKWTFRLQEYNKGT